MGTGARRSDPSGTRSYTKGNSTSWLNRDLEIRFCFQLTDKYHRFQVLLRIASIQRSGVPYCSVMFFVNLLFLLMLRDPA